MTPQSEFLVLAPIRPGAIADLRALLATMNVVPGLADPDNELVPFGAFPTLHVARFAVLEDETLDDLKAFGVSFPDAPVYLAFLGECDGEASFFLDDLAARCEPGLRQVFGHCEGFETGANLRRWMEERLVRPQAWYVNWHGRTVVQVKQEDALHAALAGELRRALGEGVTDPVRLHARLRAYVGQHGPLLTPEAPTPLDWRIRKLASLIGYLLAFALAAPLLLLASPVLLVVLRHRERYDPEITTPLDRVRRSRICAMEDQDVTNPFTAIGTVKPGLFRQALVRGVLFGLQFTLRHVYGRGRLARVGTIHFARWVVIDSGRRVLFISNYDGSLDSYMDDFINKAAFGLNLVFSNGVGYPSTDWLLLRGAKREELFKAFLQRRQQLTDVWYKAYPGLTAFNLMRNSEIRRGLEQEAMGEDELRSWLSKI